MPVGTKGTVKAMTPDRLRAVGAQIVLANTYHLALRPGSDTVKRLGGLHAFMHWDGPILTDSGGYQVFSLRDTAKMDDGGVAFRSIYDGSKHVFTPERAMAEQEALGADFIMCFDQCPPGAATEAEVADAVRRTSLWAERCKRRPPEVRRHRDRRAADAAGHHAGRSHPAVCGRQSAERLREIGFPGYAIGGLTVGEDRSAMLEATSVATDLLPADRLRYFMGIGDPEGLVEVIARGVDMFDCVLPTRTARMGTAFTPTGRLNLRNAEHALLDRTARSHLPLSGLHAVLPGGHPALRHAEGDTGDDPAYGAQSDVPHQAGGRGPEGHSGRAFCRLQKRPQCCIFGNIAFHVLGLRPRLPFCGRAIGN